MDAEAYLNQIATAVPPHERHSHFMESLPHWMGPPEVVDKVRLILAKSQIERRHTVLENPLGPRGSGAFYEYGTFPSTQRRMETYRREALPLASRAVAALPLARHGDLGRVTHLIVTSCTGFYAPGLDIDLIAHFGLSPQTKRSIIGFMGCYAAMSGLRAARETVLGDPEACVLMVNLELCSLHLQETELFDRLVSFLLFADGAAASVISGQRCGLRLDQATSHLSLPDADRMGWIIEDSGFAMTLDSRVPAKIRQFIRRNPASVGLEEGTTAGDYLWAVHPGGRAILDAVQDACQIPDSHMTASRAVLRDFGNMSSATIMFALRSLLESADGQERPGRAIAFGPGLTLEGIEFTRLAVRNSARVAETPGEEWATGAAVAALSQGF